MEEYFSPISGKKKRKSLFDLEKKESKKQKSCQKIIGVYEQEPSVQSAGRGRAVQIEEMYLTKSGNWSSLSEQ